MSATELTAAPANATPSILFSHSASSQLLRFADAQQPAEKKTTSKGRFPSTLTGIRAKLLTPSRGITAWISPSSTQQSTMAGSDGRATGEDVGPATA